jgi:hypothetical protein
MGNYLVGQQGRVGDSWELKCKDNGIVTLIVDTQALDDTTAYIDPVLYVTKEGKTTLLAFADDNEPCTFPTACGFLCAKIDFPCQKHKTYDLYVTDYGTATATTEQCSLHGNYTLTASSDRVKFELAKKPNVDDNQILDFFTPSPASAQALAPTDAPNELDSASAAELQRSRAK